MSALKKIDINRLPAHIAIIMDGNGRWAKKRGLPRIFGHRVAAKNVHTIVEACSVLGVKALTLYAFSTENWSRPGAEVRGLMTLLKTFLKKEYPYMVKNRIRFRTIGDISKLSEALAAELRRVTESTAHHEGLILNLALNYGGRQEIVRAVNRLIADGHKAADEDLIASYLDTAGQPEPDLMIRTSGELRLSNFLLWQIAYAEFYFTGVNWPDFTPEHLYEAIVDYQTRERRFGGIEKKEPGTKK